MIANFEQLDNNEKELMYSLPIYVAILIAGADGKIDSSEIKKATSVASIKATKSRKELIEYFNVVNQDYEDKLKMAIANLPLGVKEREKLITEKLAQSSSIFKKLERPYAIKLYSALKDIAKQVAEASGGIFGYMSIGYEESKLVDLKMIKDPSK